MPITQTKTKVTTWGNSKGMRIPKDVIKTLDLKDNQEIKIEIKGHTMVLTPVSKEPQNIHDLFNGWVDDGVRTKEMEWGSPVGEEFKW